MDWNIANEKDSATVKLELNIYSTHPARNPEDRASWLSILDDIMVARRAGAGKAPLLYGLSELHQFLRSASALSNLSFVTKLKKW